MQMRRIRYNFYAKISKSRGLNFGNVGGRVEPHTFSTRNKVPSNEPKRLNFFYVPNLHTRYVGEIDRFQFTHRGKIEALTGNYGKADVVV